MYKLSQAQLHDQSCAEISRKLNEGEHWAFEINDEGISFRSGDKDVETVAPQSLTNLILYINHHFSRSTRVTAKLVIESETTSIIPPLETIAMKQCQNDHTAEETVSNFEGMSRSGHYSRRSRP